jgi:hypothetical protein
MGEHSIDLFFLDRPSLTWEKIHRSFISSCRTFLRNRRQPDRSKWYPTKQWMASLRHQNLICYHIGFLRCPAKRNRNKLSLAESIWLGELHQRNSTSNGNHLCIRGCISRCHSFQYHHFEFFLQDFLSDGCGRVVLYMESRIFLGVIQCLIYSSF